MNLTTTTSQTAGFPLVIATQSHQATAQLKLRNTQGQVVQQWMVSSNKCTLGSAASCALRCELPGVAPYHALLVIGARQIFIRALAPKLTRDGQAFNELLLTNTDSHFEIAGHRFELSRSSADIPPQVAPALRPGSATPQRIKFTLARPFELRNRTPAAPTAQVRAALQAAELAFDEPASGDPKWVAQLIQAAVQPLECQLQNLAQPLSELQRESRKQRRMRKQRAIRKRDAAKAQPDMVSQELIDESSSQRDAQVKLSEQVEAIAVQHAAAMEVLTERILTVNQQLLAIEQIVTEQRLASQAEDDPQPAPESPQLTLQSAAIELLQQNVSIVSSTLERLQAEQVAVREDDQHWKNGLQSQLSDLAQFIEGLSDSVTEVHQVALRAAAHHDAEQAAAWLPASDTYIESEFAAQSPASTALPEPEADPQHTSWVTSDAEYADAQLDAQFDAQLDARFDAQLGAQLDAQFDAQSDAQSDAQPDARLDAQFDAPLDTQFDSQLDTQFDAPLDAQFDAQLDTQHDSQPDTRPDTRLHLRATDQTDTQPESSQEAALPGSTALPSWWASDDQQSDQQFDQPRSESNALVGAACQADISHGHHDQPLWDAAGHEVDGQEFARLEAASCEAIRHEATGGSVERVYDGSSPIDDLVSERLYAAEAAPVGEAAGPSDQPSEEFFGLTQFASEDHLREEQSLPLAQRALAYQSDADADELPAELPYNLPLAHEDRSIAIGDSPADEQADEQSLYGVDQSETLHSETPFGTPLGETNATGLDDSDSVEEYMRKLLARMRGVPEDEVQMPVQSASPTSATDSAALASVATSEAQSVAATQTSAMGTFGESSSEDFTEDYGAGTLSGQIGATEPFDPEKYMPRALAPERSNSLAAMRELANSSARTAIHKSTRQRHVSSIALKSVIAGVGLVVGMVLLAINGLNLNIGLIATVASFMVAAIWGYDTLSSIRPMLQSGLILNPLTDSQPAPADEQE